MRAGSNTHATRIGPRAWGCICAKWLASIPFYVPTLGSTSAQIVAERDGLRKDLSDARDALATTKQQNNNLDVAAIQQSATVERLRVRSRACPPPGECMPIK